jgi:sodium-dependent dicarboxylate transporter 2/3/5
MEVVIDTRPLWVILLSRSTRILKIALGLIVFWAVLAMDRPENLPAEGQRALAVFGLCVIFWAFNVLPLMITRLLAIVLISWTGVMSHEEAFALFGNSAVFFILGAFILAACMMKSGLSTRMSLVFLQKFGHSPRRLLAAIFLLNAFMSFFMSEHAVAAMNFPIVAEIVAVLGLRPHRGNYAKALFIALAWGSTIGGVATLLGGGRAPLALAVLEQTTSESPYTFLSWMIHTIPIVVPMLLLGYFVITRFFPVDVDSVKDAEDALAEKVHALGRTTIEERAIGLVMLGTICVWITAGHELGLANVAIAAVVLLFLLRLVAWRDVEEYVNWGIILMYGGAICLGKALAASGGALWLAETTVGAWAGSASSVVAGLSLATWLLTEAMSNSAVVALMMPVGLAIADNVGLQASLIAPVIAVPAGLAFAFPIGTPANAIAYSSGYLRLRDLILPGMLMGFVAWIVFNIAANYYWPWIGSPLTG